MKAKVKKMLGQAIGNETFCDCSVKFNDTKETETVTIKLNREVIEGEDDEMFFYCEGLDEFKELCEPNNGEDFVVVDIFAIY